MRACVLPVFDYAIETWGTTLPQDAARSFQAQLAKPLRAALRLPVTTHQHSVLWGCGVPALATHVQHKQLLHLQRVSRLLREDSSHPTARLYEWTRHQLVHKHHRLLGVHSTLPLPVYLLTALLPFTHPPAEPDPLHIAHHSPADGPLLPSATAWQARVRLAHQWSEPAPGTGTGTVPRRHCHTLDTSWTTLQALSEPAGPAAADGARAPPGPRARPRDWGALRRVRDAAARLEWMESHMPATPELCAALPASERARRTTAPITRCAYDVTDATGPPLRFLRARYTLDMDPLQLVRRTRLLFGRSYTATVRHRFPSAAVAGAVAGVDCPHPGCSAGGRAETIEHLLLACPLYDAARDALQHQLAGHDLRLTLRSILNPPERRTASYLAVCRATDAFLAAIEAERIAHGMPSLDSCPRYSASSSSSGRPATAPLPLDTG